MTVFGDSIVVAVVPGAPMTGSPGEAIRFVSIDTNQ